MTTNKELRKEVWNDETLHPNTAAATIALEATNANGDLVREWQDLNAGCDSWMTFQAFIEGSIQMFGETQIDCHQTPIDWMRTHEHYARLWEQLSLVSDDHTYDQHGASGSDREWLAKRRKEQQASTPPLSLKASVQIPGHFSARVEVFEEDVKLTGWTFEPSGSSAGYFGPSAVLGNVEDSNGDEASERETVEVDDLLNADVTDGPFWRAVQEHLASTPAITVNWEE